MSQVSHPSHYNAGKIEVIEGIEAWGFGPGFRRGNAIKYIARAGKKDPEKELEDLEKAAWYLAREIEILKAVREGREPLRPNDMNPKTPFLHSEHRCVFPLIGTNGIYCGDERFGASQLCQKHFQEAAAR